MKPIYLTTDEATLTVDLLAACCEYYGDQMAKTTFLSSKLDGASAKTAREILRRVMTKITKATVVPKEPTHV